MATHALIAKNISKTYHKRQVVDHVSLTVKSGEVVGLLGPNGAGKTTCFYMISGLIKLGSGQILLNKHLIHKLPIDKRALLGIGYLPQEPSIFRRLSVENNIMAVLQIHKGWHKAKRLARLESLLEEFNIVGIRNSLGISLSGGERRRVEVARVLAMNPKFILFDEPFAGIDPIALGHLQKLIYMLKKQNIGILITDHNYREILDICDHSYVLSEGRIIAQGAKADILKHKEVQNVYLGESNI